MGTLRAILMDVDDTLYSTTAFAALARRNAMTAIAGQSGVQVTADRLLAELREVIHEFGPNFHAHYDRLLRRFPAEALGGHGRGLLVAAGVAAYHDTKKAGMEPFPGVLELLGDLRRAEPDLVLGVITEGLEVKQAEKLLRLGVYRFLSPAAVFVSDAIGISKPNPKLWQRACAAVGAPPGEVLYVGDNPANDIVPARATGMPTVRLRCPGGKYASVESPEPPDHEVGDWEGLRRVLREACGLRV